MKVETTITEQTVVCTENVYEVHNTVNTWVVEDLHSVQLTCDGTLRATISAAENVVGGHKAITATGHIADNGNLAHASRVIGVTTNSAVTGDPLSVVQAGFITEPSWSFAPGLPIFVGAEGTLTQTPPVPPAAFSQIIGVALSPNKIIVDISCVFIIG